LASPPRQCCPRGRAAGDFFFSLSANNTALQEQQRGYYVALTGGDGLHAALVKHGTSHDAFAE